MMTMRQVRDFMAHVNAPVEEGGHGFLLGIDGAPVVSIGPTWHYHEHLHRSGRKGPAHSHTEGEFGEPSDPGPDPRDTSISGSRMRLGRQ